MPTLEYFFDFSSPYSYLASTQLEGLAARTGVQIRWRPFLLGALFKAIQTAPPIYNQARIAYMLKDLGDWSRHYGLPEVRIPETFPFLSVKSLRLALVAEEQGRMPAFGPRMFRAIWQQGQDATSEGVLTGVLTQVGLEPAACFARAEAPEIKERLKKNGEEALARGVFGAPTFFVGGEIFFGNDRLLFVEQKLKAR
ncbi:MAG TPA: 2-hydroxychromene-2-carboxylate isomerase [Myxococcaceae bacterium]|nr:2-hydroxychromene-2-carboxylate isomerase [Myxococcaceae bacterium]